MRVDGTTSPQSITAFNSSVNRFYGYYQTTSAARPQIFFRYNEKSSINDKYIESIHFTFYGSSRTDFYVPYTFNVVDTYGNTISCHSDASGSTYDVVDNGIVVGQGHDGRMITNVSCEKGHISGSFYVNVGSYFTNTIGWYGISELSIHYDDEVDATSQTLNDIKNNTKETNDLIKNDNVDGANTQGSSFFSNFSSNTHGLSGIVSSPIRLINSLSSSTCSPLTFTIPFVNSQVALPCMSSIYSTHFPTLLSIYQLITTGLIAYKILINLFGVVKGLQDPDSSRIEVVDL